MELLTNHLLQFSSSSLSAISNDFLHLILCKFYRYVLEDFSMTLSSFHLFSLQKEVAALWCFSCFVIRQLRKCLVSFIFH